MDNIDSLLECGFTKPVAKMELSDKISLIQTVALHKVVLGCLAELSVLQWSEFSGSSGCSEAIP